MTTQEDFRLGTPGSNGHVVPDGLRLWDRDELDHLPEPKALIRDTLDRGTVFNLSGSFGTLKSFITVSWHCCVATGTPWMGRAVPQAVPTMLCATEGRSGLARRIRAWEDANGIRVPKDMLWVPKDPVRLSDIRWVRQAIVSIGERDIRLLTVDTLSRAIPGTEENNAKEMSAVIDNMYLLLTAMNDDGAAGFVHHTGKDKATVRGSSVLEANVDTVYVTSGNDRATEMRRTKRKDGPASDRLDLYLELLPGWDSGVVQNAQTGLGNTPGQKGHSKIILDVLCAVYPAMHPTAKQLHELCDRMGRTVFHETLNRLVTSGDVVATREGRLVRYGLP